MHMYQVGKPYVEGKAGWPERTEYNWRRGGHEMRMFFHMPSDAEIRDVRAGRWELGLYVSHGGEQVFLCYRTDTIPYSDAPYTYHRLTDEMRELPPVLGPQEMPLLHIFLVGARSGILVAIRVLSLPHVFGVVLHEAIRAQAALPWDSAVYDANLAAVYARYPTSRDLMRHAQARVTIPAPQRGA